MNKTERKLRHAFESATPNVLNSVLHNCNAEKQPVVQNKEKKPIRWKELAATAAALVLLFGVGYIGATVLGSGFTMSPSVKPTDAVCTEPHDPPVDRFEENALAMALEDAGVSMDKLTGFSVKFDKKDGKTHFLVCFETTGQEYTYYVPTNPLDNSVEGHVATLNTPDMYVSSIIGRLKAVNIALSHAGLNRRNLKELQTDYDVENGVQVFIVHFDDYVSTYDYRINAHTGKILGDDGTTPTDPIEPPDGKQPPEHAIMQALEHYNLTQDMVTDLQCLLKTYQTDNTPYYCVTFLCDDVRYLIEVQPYTLEILKDEHTPLTPDDLQRFYLSDALLQQIKEDFLVFRGLTSSKTESVYVDYYGQYNDAFVMFIHFGLGNDVITGDAVEDLSFLYPQDNKLQVYYNRTFYGLEEAYRLKIMDYEEFKELHSYYIPKLSDDTDLKIRQDYLLQNMPVPPGITVDQISIRYFGEYGGAHVMFMNGLESAVAAPWSETIGGCEFNYTTSDALTVYHEGTFYSLQEAYDKEILTKYSLEKLHHSYSSYR